MNARTIARRTAGALVGFVEGFIPLAASIGTGLYLLDRPTPLLDMPGVDAATDVKALAIVGALLALAAVSSFTDGPLAALRHRVNRRPFGPCPNCGELVIDPHLAADQALAAEETAK